MRAGVVVLAVSILAVSIEATGESTLDFERYRREAREVFLIKIEKVKLVRVVHERNEHEVIFARARVLKIMRTSSGVSSGEAVYIRYIHRFISYPGSTIPAVREGAVYTAYLNAILDKSLEDVKVLPGWNADRQYFPCVDRWSFVEYPAW